MKKEEKQKLANNNTLGNGRSLKRLRLLRLLKSSRLTKAYLEEDGKCLIYVLFLGGYALLIRGVKQE